MQMFSPSFLDTAAQDKGWISALSGDSGSPLRERITCGLACVSSDVSALVMEMLTGEQAHLGRATLQSLALASVCGARPVSALDPHLIRMEGTSGVPFVLGTIAFAMPSGPLGDRESLARLLSALEKAFGDRRYLLFIRRVLPPDLDPAAVARAVQLWLVAIERGEWVGRHAVYEDEQVAVELTLLEPVDDQPSGMAFMVGPTDALERMSYVDGRMLELVGRHLQLAPEFPLVVALAGDTRWRLPRGYVEQLLYGTADWVTSRHEGAASTYVAGFHPEGLSLFSDPGCRQLASLWWIEPAGDDPLGFRTWATDNPWCESVAVPIFNGRRFTVADTLDAELPLTGRHDEAILTWLGSAPQSWMP